MYFKIIFSHIILISFKASDDDRLEDTTADETSASRARTRNSFLPFTNSTTSSTDVVETVSANTRRTPKTSSQRPNITQTLMPQYVPSSSSTSATTSTHQSASQPITSVTFPAPTSRRHSNSSNQTQTTSDTLTTNSMFPINTPIGGIHPPRTTIPSTSSSNGRYFKLNI